MIVARWHDRLMLGGTLAGAAGVVVLRNFEGPLRTAGIALAAAGLVALACGIIWKIKKGR